MYCLIIVVTRWSFVMVRRRIVCCVWILPSHFLTVFLLIAIIIPITHTLLDPILPTLVLTQEFALADQIYI